MAHREIQPLLTMSSRRGRFNPSGMLEFEPVSIAKARAVANRLPGGVETMLDRMPNGWDKVREPLEVQDLKLKPDTLAWMRQLPKDLMPVFTATAFPRVLNRIAGAWYSHDELEVIWEDIFQNNRRNRRGFPLNVRNELNALRALAKPAAR
jgi:hypothetical protein